MSFYRLIDILNQIHEPRFRGPRIWSNKQLQLLAPFLFGDIINISAGTDIDKQGNSYRNYFTNADSYWISNYPKALYRGYQGLDNEIKLDLESVIPDELKSAFDVVFNHTTLEHVFDTRTAFSNLCRISRDLVIVVVPFCQLHHENTGYQDFWRFTPTCLRELFRREGFCVIYESCNNVFNNSVYIFMVGTKKPDKWKDIFPCSKIPYPCGEWLGASPTFGQVLMLAHMFVIHRCSRLIRRLLSISSRQ